MNHKLKTWPEYFQKVWTGEKTFEVRLNDRNFQIGDKLWLQEYDNQKHEFTGKYIKTTVTYVLDLSVILGFPTNYCVLGISVELAGFDFAKTL
ncbi:DUF3850 domain-containing protein [Emticicia sp. 17c]|uniref:DUF3850 domain-containing protein n=1 Tax=Emticicia sp. 17c TaxID=3127704 RepID=UPI00301C71E9